MLTAFYRLVLRLLLIISLEDAEKHIHNYYCCARARMWKCLSQIGSTWTHPQQQQPSRSDRRGPFKNLLGVEKGSSSLNLKPNGHVTFGFALRSMYLYMNLKLGLSFFFNKSRFVNAWIYFWWGKIDFSNEYWLLTPRKVPTKVLCIWNRTRPSGFRSLFSSRALNKEKVGKTAGFFWIPVSFYGQRSLRKAGCSVFRSTCESRRYFLLFRADERAEPPETRRDGYSAVVARRLRGSLKTHCFCCGKPPQRWSEDGASSSGVQRLLSGQSRLQRDSQVVWSRAGEDE